MSWGFEGTNVLKEIAAQLKRIANALEKRDATPAPGTGCSQCGASPADTRSLWLVAGRWYCRECCTTPGWSAR